MHLFPRPGVKGQSQVTDILNMCVSLNTCVLMLMFMEVIFTKAYARIYNISKTKWNLLNLIRAALVRV
jgi:hypothetical protein